jgi:hypothetical protein
MELFKYIAPSRIDILEDLMIRFTRPNDFNDPFESLPSLGGIKELALEDDFYNENLKEKFEALQKESLLKHLPTNVPVPDDMKDSYTKMTLGEAAYHVFGISNIFKKVISEFPDKVEEQIAAKLNQDLNKRFGILCLSENHNNLTMWSHYSQNHEGFVIGFNSESPFFDQRKSKTDLIRFITKVIYIDKRPELQLYNIKKNSQELGDYIIKYLFLTKSKHWESEQEWRMILDLKDVDTITEVENKKIFLFKYPSSMITSIYLGVKINDNLRSKIIQIATNLKVPIFQAYRDSKEYKIIFRLIE